MKILVTGGAGFIGSHVVDAYVGAGHQVVVVDNLATGRREQVNAAAQLYALDIRSPELRDVFERERPDVVNHHAAQASVTASVADPRADAEINVMGTLHLMTLCAKFAVRRFVSASTGGAIYGNPQHIPADEQHPTTPLSPYGIHKLVGEHYVRYFGSMGMTWAILRYANVYGPRQDPFGEAGVIAIFTQTMLSGHAPTIFGDGTQTRDFVYVEDVARANLLATTSSTSDMANIGTGTETAINDLYRHLAQLTGFGAQPVYAPRRSGEVDRIALDPTRATRWLEWKARTPLLAGLRQTVQALQRTQSTR